VNIKDVQSFLESANFYRRFIKGYSITAPLTELTKKESEFKWTEEANQTFERLKRAFVTTTLLITFDPENLIRVETDSSDRIRH